MNQYLLSAYEVESRVAGASPTAEEMQAFMGRVIALEEEMDRAGAFAFGGALHGADAATVVRGGTGLDKVTTDGPFVEGKEHIGGFYIVNAEDLDEALAWAEKVVEAINHDIEVRPFRATGRLQSGAGH
ncbi:MAG: YciI family protein [Jiangellaceae bacterium]